MLVSRPHELPQQLRMFREGPDPRGSRGKDRVSKTVREQPVSGFFSVSGPVRDGKPGPVFLYFMFINLKIQKSFFVLLLNSSTGF